MIDAPEFHDVKLKEYCTEASIDLKERTFAMYFATPFSGCGLLAPLSFFLMFQEAWRQDGAQSYNKPNHLSISRVND
ncbi:MAG: hypothetical protein MUO81_08755 [Thermoplasmata archaeon]|nr:hypothetical protein [Thermoplasmata archaeon]